MPDITDQLRHYADAAADRVPPATAPSTPNLGGEDLVMSPITKISEGGARGATERSPRVAWMAVAAAVAVIALVAGALAIAREGDEDTDVITTSPETTGTVPEPEATYDGSIPPELVVVAGDQRLELESNAGYSWSEDLGDDNVRSVIADAVVPDPANVPTITVPAGADLRLVLPGPRWDVHVSLIQNGVDECPVRYDQTLARSDSGEFGVPTPVPADQYLAVVDASIDQPGDSGGSGGYAFNVLVSEPSPMPPRTAEVWWFGDGVVPDTVAVWHPDALDDHPSGNVTVWSGDTPGTVALAPSNAENCARGGTWLGTSEEDEADVQAALAPDEQTFQLEVRFADGVWYSEPLPVGDGHMVVPLAQAVTQELPGSSESETTEPPPTASDPTDGSPGVACDALVPPQCYDFEWLRLPRADAIAKAEAEGREWREVDLDHESMDGTLGLDPDEKRPGRVTFVVGCLPWIRLSCVDGVTYALVEDETTGPDDDYREGAIDTRDLVYVGLALPEAQALAEQNGHDYCPLPDEACLEYGSPERRNFRTAVTETGIEVVIAVTRG